MHACSSDMQDPMKVTGIMVNTDVNADDVLIRLCPKLNTSVHVLARAYQRLKKMRN